MKTIAAPIAILASLALGAFTPSHAQELTPGSWTGSVTPPGGEAIPVTFDVSGTGGALAVVMSAPMIEGTISFNEIRVEGGMLMFWWEPGVRVDCHLTRNAAGSYEGTCSDGTGSGQGAMTMTPPAEQ